MTRAPEHVNMDFKSVVYNAARDGKLKRLKVSCPPRDDDDDDDGA